MNPTKQTPKDAKTQKFQPGGALSRDDQETIEQATGGMADRDQMFDEGHRMSPPASQMERYEDWDADLEKRQSAQAARSVDTNIVEEFKQLEQNLADPEPAVKPLERQIPVPKAAVPQRLTRLSSQRLKARAEALGIAGRQNMDRRQLVEAIKAQQAQSLS